MASEQRIDKLIRTRFPLIQAPMLGVTTPEMVAAAARAGCLGSLALGDLTAEKSVELIRATRRLTDQPFAVNIFVNEIPPKTDQLRARYEEVKAFIAGLAEQHHIRVDLPGVDEIALNSYHEKIDAVISEACPLLSFTFGNLDQENIQKLKNKDITLIGTCTSVREARILESSGMDIICVQGIEAGGHRGSFAPGEFPKIGGLSLLAQVHEAVRVPLIYAGGLYNISTLKAARALGAQAFQLGSVLLCSKESALQPFEKDRLKKLREEDIVLTRSFTGRYARGVRNTYIEAVDQTPYILPYPYQNKLTAALRQVARASGNADFVSIWAGQSVHGFSEASAEEILGGLAKSLN